MLIDTIDLYQFIAAFVTLNWAGVSRSVDGLLHFLTHFSTDQNIWCGFEAIQVIIQIQIFWVRCM